MRVPCNNTYFRNTHDYEELVATKCSNSLYENANNSSDTREDIKYYLVVLIVQHNMVRSGRPTHKNAVSTVIGCADPTDQTNADWILIGMHWHRSGFSCHDKNSVD